MRLHIFNLLIGNWVGLGFLSQELGVRRALIAGVLLQKRMIWNNPFSELNRKKPPTAREKMSQLQMAPLVILYNLLQTRFGLSQNQTRDILSRLGEKIALRFLKFNIPTITPAMQTMGANDRQNLIAKIMRRFFNIRAVVDESEASEFAFHVHECHFASYVRQLGLPELGAIFCASDKLYFQTHQPNINFERTVTLMRDQKPCDFHLRLKN